MVTRNDRPIDQKRVAEWENGAKGETDQQREADQDLRGPIGPQVGERELKKVADATALRCSLGLLQPLLVQGSEGLPVGDAGSPLRVLSRACPDELLETLRSVGCEQETDKGRDRCLAARVSLQSLALQSAGQRILVDGPGGDCLVDPLQTA